MSREKKIFKKFIRQKSLGFQKNAEGTIAYDIHECVVEWWDGSTETVWRMWDVTVPFTQDKYTDFLFEQPQVDIPVSDGKIHTSI